MKKVSVQGHPGLSLCLLMGRWIMSVHPIKSIYQVYPNLTFLCFQITSLVLICSSQIVAKASHLEWVFTNVKRIIYKFRRSKDIMEPISQTFSIGRVRGTEGALKTRPIL